MANLNSVFSKNITPPDVVPTKVVNIPTNTGGPFVLKPGSLNVVLPTNTNANLPLIVNPTVNMLPNLIKTNDQVYMLNEVGTLNALYGPIVLPWNTNFETLNDIRQQQDVNSINKDTAFQQKVLHVDYNINRIPAIPKIIVGRVPLVPIVPVVPIVPLVPMIGKPTILPSTTKTEPKPFISIPIAQPSIVVPIAQPSIVVPIAQPSIVVPIAQPSIVVPIAQPSIVVPIAQVVKPFIVVPIAQPSIVVPIAQVVKPFIVVPIPQVVKPSIAVPIPKPSIAVPIPKPSIAVPIAKPSIAVPIAQAAQAFIPGPIVTVAKPFIPGPITPGVRRAIAVPIVPPTRITAPLSPNTTAVAVSNGITSVRDISNFKIPNVFAQQLTIREPTNAVPIIRMPTFNTIVTPIEIPLRRPDITPALNSEQLLGQGGHETIATVLAAINPALLIPTRVGKNKQVYGRDGKSSQGYSRTQLLDFARRLGISVSGDRKQQIIDEIFKLRREMGL